MYMVVIVAEAAAMVVQVVFLCGCVADVPDVGRTSSADRSGVGDGDTLATSVVSTATTIASVLLEWRRW